MATTLDITSRGRLEVGVGAGWNEEECQAYGIDLGSMADRFDRFDEGMEVLRLLLTQDRSDFAGKWYSLDNAMNNPKPVQDPLPICVGGSGLKRTIPAAAKYADHWNYGSPTMNVDDFAMRNKVFLESLAAEGRAREDVTVSVIVRYNGDPDAMVREAEAFGAAGIDLGIVSIPKSDDPGIVEPIAEALAALT